MNQKTTPLFMGLLFMVAISAAIFIVLEYNRALNEVIYAVPGISSSKNNSTSSGLQKKIKPHVPLPETVKGLYLTAYTAGGDRLEEFIRLAEQTELNALVIDVKNQQGSLAFKPRTEALIPYQHKEITPLENLDAVLDQLYDHGVYRIARVPVFLDPFYAKKHPEYAVKTKWGDLWKDYRGQYWLHPAKKQVWDYHVLLAKEMVERGFDEIQFDYIRFPSDGPISQIDYDLKEGQEKHEVIKRVFQYFNDRLRTEGIDTSADLFGLTFWMTDFDLNIGQLLEDAIPYFDAISPMVYPSHYPDGYLGYANPARFPYEIIYKNMMKGKTVYKKLGLPFTARPWIQAFDMGAVYDASMIRKQMRAIYDAGGAGWILWNARNRYVEEALLQED